MSLFEGITARVVETDRLVVSVLERTSDVVAASSELTVVFLHPTVGSSILWQEVMLDLPGDVRAIAIDLRGYGGTEHAPVDATRGVRDFSDDVHETLAILGVERPHLVGWALGGAVAMQYAIDHPVASLTLQSPISPYGFGGTRRDGSLLTDDAAGTGGGGANPEFVRRLTERDASDEAPTSPRTVFRTEYVSDDYRTEHEDEWVESMLTTSTAPGNYPGESIGSDNWPGYAPARSGVLNALSPLHLDLSGIVDVSPRPPVLWVHGLADPIVSDVSIADVNQLGKAGIAPEWPGDEVAPPQPMVTQTRDVLDAYARAGGVVTELPLDGVRHAAHLERPAVFRAALLAHIGYLGRPAEPAPPTEAIILRSAD